MTLLRDYSARILSILRPIKRSKLAVLPWIFTVSLCLVNTAAAAPSERQLTLFSNNCLQCHAAPHISAPQLGNPSDWEDINAQGEETVLKHVAEGMGGMPPLGYCSACDEQDLRQLIYLMTGMQPSIKSSTQHLKESL